MDKNFLNIHVLISHSPSCLNRDDMNMQKSAVFGGKRRVRISSQSLKRAIRESEYYKRYFDTSVRTRFLVDRLVSELKSKTEDEKKLKALEESGLFIAAIISGKEKPDDIKKFKRGEDSGSIETQVLPYHRQEIDEINKLLIDSIDIPTTNKIKMLKDEMYKLQKKQKSQISLDVALAGRMAPSQLIYEVDGAVSVAHAITTHSVDADIDWFTAVDDLVEEEGESGAGHLNTQEFSAGVFYRYASLNLRQLQDNLGGAARDKALEIGAHLLYLFATVVPSAKQQAFAAHNVADLVLASFSDMPLSLANGFENPVRDRGGYLKPSAEALIKYWHKLQNSYGLGDEARLFCLVDDVLVENQAPILQAVPTLQALQDWVKTDAEGGSNDRARVSDSQA
jgi:CRISPR system Cascade subunit CasC